MDDRSLKLTAKEISSAFAEGRWADCYPPILNIEQAAELLQMPIGTLRAWRSQGLLGSCSRRLGKHVRFYRDRLIDCAFNQGILND